MVIDGGKLVLKLVSVELTVDRNHHVPIWSFTHAFIYSINIYGMTTVCPALFKGLWVPHPSESRPFLEGTYLLKEEIRFFLKI